MYELFANGSAIEDSGFISACSICFKYNYQFNPSMCGMYMCLTCLEHDCVLYVYLPH